MRVLTRWWLLFCFQKKKSWSARFFFVNKPGAVEAQGTTAAKTITTADGVTRERKRNDEVKLTGQTPLGVAVMQNNLEVVKLLIQTAPDYVNAQDRSGNTAMHYAVFKGNMEIVAALSSVEGIDLNIFNNAGQKPIAVILQGVLHCEGVDN